jgi:hypothetical protein
MAGKGLQRQATMDAPPGSQMIMAKTAELLTPLHDDFVL